MGSQTSENAIPTVDISTLLSPTASETDRRRVIEDVRQASTTYGFFNLVGHGIPPFVLSIRPGCLSASRHSSSDGKFRQMIPRRARS